MQEQRQRSFRTRTQLKGKMSLISRALSHDVEQHRENWLERKRGSRMKRLDVISKHSFMALSSLVIRRSFRCWKKAWSKSVVHTMSDLDMTFGYSHMDRPSCCGTTRYHGQSGHAFKGSCTLAFGDCTFMGVWWLERHRLGWVSFWKSSRETQGWCHF